MRALIVISVAAWAAQARAETCDEEILKIASHQMLVGRRELRRATERRPALPAVEAAQRAGLTTVEQLDVLIAERRASWREIDSSSRELLERIAPISDRLARTLAVCRAENRQELVTMIERQTTALDEVRERLRLVDDRARCEVVAEEPELRRRMLTARLNKMGISPEIYRLGESYSFLASNDRELRNAIVGACVGQGKSEPEKTDWSKLLAGIEHLQKSAFGPYEEFVLKPEPSTDREASRKRFVQRLFAEASNGRADGTRTLLEKGSYAVRLDVREEVDQMTLLMAAAISGNPQLLEWLVEFARAHPERGRLPVDARDRKGRTALDYCAKRPECKADLLRSLAR